MKKVLLLLLVSFVIANLQAQELNVYDEMLNKSLERYVEETQKTHDAFWQSRDNTVTLDFSRFYINLEGFPKDFKFSQKIQDFGFGYIHMLDRDTHKLFKKEKPVLFLYGPFIDGNKLKISIKAGSVHAKTKNHYYIQFSPDEGRFSCIWEYSCETGEWKLTEFGTE